MMGEDMPRSKPKRRRHDVLNDQSGNAMHENEMLGCGTKEQKVDLVGMMTVADMVCDEVIDWEGGLTQAIGQRERAFLAQTKMNIMNGSNSKVKA